MSTNPEKQSDSNSSEKPKPTDEVRPDIKAAAKPMETANFSEGKSSKAMEIRNDSAGSN
jgi:hypothetical protein